jgi:hypothetical protein
MNDPQTCPSCDKPADKLIAGVCERCKKSIEAANKRIEVKWTADDFSIRVNRQHAEAITEADDHQEPELVELEHQESDNGDQKAVEVLRRMRVGFGVCINYDGDFGLAFHCFALAMGFKGVVGVDDDTELAKRFSVSKQAVTKCKLIFQERMGLPPMQGQRSERARDNMRKARQEQLKPETK